MYLVKREVFATSVEKAITSKGKIYSIELADDKFQIKKKPDVGFTKKK